MDEIIIDMTLSFPDTEDGFEKRDTAFVLLGEAAVHELITNFVAELPDGG